MPKTSQLAINNVFFLKFFKLVNKEEWTINGVEIALYSKKSTLTFAGVNLFCPADTTLICQQQLVAGW